MSHALSVASEYFNDLPTWAKAIIGTTAAFSTSYVLWSYNRRRPSPYKKDFTQGVVYLYQCGRFRCIPSISPYCLKLETWLRMADIKYENVEIPCSIRSKEGTLPFIELDGKEFCDSGFIIGDLTEICNKQHMDAQLANEQKAVARAFEQMAENTTTHTVTRVIFLDKWNELCSEKIMPSHFAFYSKIPFVRWCMQSSVRKKLYLHGIGKHAADEIDNIGMDDLKAISAYLGVKKFFLGEQPHRVDASLFGVLAQIAYIPIDTKLKQFFVNECPNLVKYCDRIRDTFWPDWQEICEKLLLNTPHMRK